MKELYVNHEACIGCGACVAIDSKHFDFNEDGLSEVISNEEIETDDCKNAMASCPTNAISYVVDTTGENVENKDCQCENCNCENCECEEDECHSKEETCDCNHNCKSNEIEENESKEDECHSKEEVCNCNHDEQ